MENDKKELFSIPIYSCKKDKFIKDYNKYILNKSKLLRKSAIDTGAMSINQVIEKTKEQYWLEGIWVYNQIIGYIKIYLYESSIWFDLYLPN